MNNNVIMHKSLGQVEIHSVKVIVHQNSFQREINVTFLLVHAGSFITVKRTFSDEVLSSQSDDKTYDMIAKAFEIEGYGSSLKDVFYDSISSNYKPKSAIIKYDSTNSGMILGNSGEGIDSVDLEKYLKQLPGIYEEVKHPVRKTTESIKDIIINLNDNQGWTREQIADWLDTLDVDLRFKSQDDTVVMPVKKSPQPVKSEQEIKIKQLEDTIKVLMTQMDNMKITLANVNEKFLALKEAIDNEQS